MKFEDLLREHNIPIAPPGHHHTRPGWIQIDCPHCGKGSGRYRMGYNIRGNYANCWKCGPCRLAGVIQELFNLPAVEALTIARTIEGDNTLEVPESKPRGVLKLPKGLRPLGEEECKAHRRYLASRGFNWRELESLWGVGAIPNSSECAWRVYIPWKFQDETVSWTARSIHPTAQIRYLSAKPEQEKIAQSDLLYGEDYCRHSVIVHEGPIDAWATGPGATALGGLNYSRTQLLKISRYPRRVVCLDATPDAQRVASKLCDDLEAFPGETYNIILDSKDAGEATWREIKKLRRYLS